MKKSVWKEIAFPLMLILIFAVAVFGVTTLTKNLKNPPKITFDTPAEFSTASDKTVITGRTDPKATLVVGRDKVSVDKSGGFTYEANLVEGGQTFKFVATRWYAQGSQSIKVSRTAAVTPPETTVSPDTNPITSSQAAAGADLAASGPRENILTTFGVVALLMSGYLYQKTRKKSLKSSYRAFTTS